eukprot:2570359-Ditylum_brightwellii.AAC.1
MDLKERRHGNTDHVPMCQFSSEPKTIHDNAVNHIVNYLLTTRPKAGREQPMYGVNMKPDASRGLEIFVVLHLQEIVNKHRVRSHHQCYQGQDLS